MSFSVITLPVPPTVPEQIITDASSTVDNTTENFIMLNNTLDGLAYRTIDLNKYTGEIYLVNNASTFVVGAQNVYENFSLVGMVYEGSTSCAEITMPSPGQFVYNGPNNTLFEIKLRLSGFIAGGTETFAFRITLNGGALNTAYAETTFRTNVNGTETITINCLKKLNAGDILRVQIMGINNTIAFTAKHFNFSLIHH